MLYKKFRFFTGLILGLTVLCSIPQASFAGSTSASTQANATLAATCTISAQNLSFGNLVLPVSAQSASTSMSVLCSKNHAYTIGLAYGGVYGQGGSNSGDYYKITNAQSYCNKICGTNYYLTEYDSSGNSIGTLTELNPAGGAYAPTGTTYNSASGEYVSTNPAYAYGKMVGVSSGDNIAYFIQVPNNPAQVWNSGEQNYSSTGTGSTQTIPVVGTLVPAQSGSSYPTPDSYMDTVTATVNF
jgi:spore coat protein U-like protein